MLICDHILRKLDLERVTDFEDLFPNLMMRMMVLTLSLILRTNYRKIVNLEVSQEHKKIVNKKKRISSALVFF